MITLIIIGLILACIFDFTIAVAVIGLFWAIGDTLQLLNPYLLFDQPTLVIEIPVRLYWLWLGLCWVRGYMEAGTLGMAHVVQSDLERRADRWLELARRIYRWVTKL